ncbi:hypothetical protein VTP01DRAFT_1228 [Rhizomucor pusillus]|uniref:uncharacterized protein n=1 Tax=Rhizomucor pusillus TaxID=4840 RepID=UPI0037420E24
MADDKILCCIPARIGVLGISSILFCVYFALSIVTFVKQNDLRDWATFTQEVDTPLTDAAFNGLFIFFATIMVAYTVTSAFGFLVTFFERRTLIRVYHIVNWFFVLLILMITMAHWIYFKVKRDVYINDCQDAWNNGMHPNSEVYHPVVVPGKFPIAGGSDKRHCINLIKQLVIGSGFTVFIGNFIQLYFANCIGSYSTRQNWLHRHQRLQTHDEEELRLRKL